MDTTRLRTALAAGGGTALAGVIRAVAAVRPAAKPLHPRGSVVRATLRRTGATPPTGVAWLDQPGTDHVLVRRSRAIGLPAPAPDIHGLAVRVPVDDGHADLLLASTGLGRLTRFTLTGGLSPQARPMTTLLPYRSVRGPLLLAAVARDELIFELLCAGPTGAWRPFGELELAAEDSPDLMLSFDPVRNQVPGLENYDWVRRLREPSYLTARRSR